MKKFWIVNKVNPSTCEMLMYGYIGDDMMASDFIRELKELEGVYANINLRINSGGGNVFEGFAIYNAIRNSKAVIDTYIDGICASMGTVIALAGRRIHMSKVATFMTHCASTVAIGTASQIRSQADMVEGIEDSICSIYAKRTGLTKDEARAKYLTGEDRWLTAQQCMDEKLIDGIYDADAVDMLPESAPANVLHAIYNKTLQQTTQTPTNNMAKIVLSLAAAQILGLAATATTDGVEAPVLEAKITELNGKVTSAEADKTKAENELKELKASTVKGRVAAILEKGQADKKLTVELSNTLAQQYADKPDELEALVNVMQPYQSIADALKKDAEGDLPDALKGKTYDELHDSGKLADLKADYPEAYKAVYKAKFKKEPTS